MERIGSAYSRPPTARVQPWKFPFPRAWNWMHYTFWFPSSEGYIFWCVELDAIPLSACDMSIWPQDLARVMHVFHSARLTGSSRSFHIRSWDVLTYLVYAWSLVLLFLVL